MVVVPGSSGFLGCLGTMGSSGFSGSSAVYFSPVSTGFFWAMGLLVSLALLFF